MARRAAVRAERERAKELAAMAKAAEDAARAIDGGEGAYHCGSVAEVMAIRRLRDELAAKAAIAPERLRPSAAAAITLVPTAIPAFTDGFLIAVDESLAPLPLGEPPAVVRAAAAAVGDAADGFFGATVASSEDWTHLRAKTSMRGTNSFFHGACCR